MSLPAPDLSPWHWWVLGGVLLALEVALPSSWLVGPGIAALLTGFLALATGDWHVLLAVFAALSVAATIAWQRLFRRRAEAPAGVDAPLNRRAQALVGRHARVTEAVDEKTGSVAIDDTIWRARSAGPAIAAGETAEIASVEGTVLLVRSIPESGLQGAPSRPISRGA